MERSVKDAAAAAAAEAAAAATGNDGSGVAPFSGSEAEVAAARGAYSLASAAGVASLQAALALLARLDVSSVVAAAAGDLLVSERSAKAIALVLGGGGAMSGRPAAETLRAAASAVAVLARVSDLSAPDLAPGAIPITRGAAYEARMTRIAALGATGVYRAALAGLGTPGLVDSATHATAVVTLVARLIAVPGVDAVRLGLNKASLLALQARERG